MAEEPEVSKSGPMEPFTALIESTAAIHELFLSFMEGGFTERQALTLIAKMLMTVKEEGEDEK